MMRRTLCPLASAAIACSALVLTQPAPAHAQGQVSVMILGSSLVRGIKPNLKNLYKDAGIAKPRIKAIGAAGWDMAKHAQSGRTLRKLTKDPFDFVVMAGSSKKFNAHDYPGAIALHDRVVSTGAQPVFLMTWLPKLASLLLYDELLGERGGNTGYLPIAARLGVPMAPGGWAVRQVKLDGDPVGLWRKSTHLSPRGRYLVAAVIFATLTGTSPEGLVAPRSFGDATEYLQSLAASIVLSDDEAWPWNLPID